MKKLLLPILFVLFPLILPAQPPSRIPVTGQARNIRIMDMVEDEDGYIWFGTNKGLFRYNGTVSIPYYADGADSLSSDFILSLCPDTEHRLWIGTDKGICLLQDGEIIRGPQKNVPQDFAFGLTSISDSTLLYCSQDAIYSYNKFNGERSLLLFEEPFRMPRLIRKMGDIIWISYSLVSNQFSLFDAHFHKLKDIVLPPDEGIINMALVDQTVYVATRRGFRCYSTGGEEKELPPALRPYSRPGIIFCVANYHFGNLLFGIAHDGIKMLSRDGETVMAVAPEEHLDTNGWINVLPAAKTIWLREWEKGLRGIYGSSQQKSLPVAGIGWGEVLVNLLPGASGDNALIVTTGGLFSLNIPSESFQKLPFTPDSKIRSAFRAQNGDLLVLDRQSKLYRLRLSQGRWSLVSKTKTSLPDSYIWEDYEGNICAIKERRLHWLDETGNQHMEDLGFQGEGILAKGFDGKIYLAGRDGIFQLEIGHRFVPLPFQVPNPSCCLQDRDGNLFVGSSTHGLYILNPKTQSVNHLSPEEGLPGPSVSALALDSNGDIWVSTRNYIARVARKEPRVLFVKDFAEDFPLVYMPLCALSTQTAEGERILFGSDQAISLVIPETPQETPSIPLSLDALLVNNVRVTIPRDQSLVLNHNQNQLVFYFSGMDFQKNSQLNYACYLEGFDKDWVSMGRNISALYSNLPAGKYTFRARVYAPSGIQSPEEIAFRFRIKPAPWWSWPAILAYNLLGVLLLILIVRQGLTLQQLREKALLADADRALAESEHLLAAPEGESPEDAPEKHLSDREKEFLEKIENLVREHLSEESFNATVLSEQMGMSYTRFYLKVKELLNQTPQEYLTDQRLSLAKELLQSGNHNVSEVCYLVGFSSLPGFSRSYKKRFGVPPSEDLRAK